MGFSHWWNLSPLGRRTGADDPEVRRPATRNETGGFKCPIARPVPHPSSPVSSSSRWRPRRRPGHSPTTAREAEFGSEITVTATGVESEVAEVPVATTVITRKQMDDTQAASVTELLRRVPGLSVAQSGDSGSLTSVFTRGTNSNHTLVLFDGVRLNSPYYGGFDWSLPTTTALERIEVARGPYSALWGADAVGGVINLIPAARRTRSAAGFWPRGARTAGSGGRFPRATPARSSTFCFRISSERQRHPRKQRLQRPAGAHHRGIQLGPGSRVGLVYQDLESDIGIPFVTPGNRLPNRRQKTKQRLMAIPLKWQIGRQVESRGGGFAGPAQLRLLGSRRPVGLFLRQHRSRHRSRLAWRVTTAWAATPSAGAASGARTRSTDATPSATSLDGGTSRHLSERFCPGQLADLEEVRVALRRPLGRHRRVGSKTHRPVDFGWRLADTFELRGGYGQAYRAPSLGELYAPIGGNSELEPETSNSGELGVVYTTRNGHSRWQLTSFTTDIDDLIEFDFATSDNINIGKATIKGAEFVWDHGRTRRIVSPGHLSRHRGRPRTSLLRRPEWSASWTLNGAISKHLNGDVTVVYVGSRDDVDPVTFERNPADSYTTASLALAYSLWNGVEITGRVLNIADSDYQEILGYPAPGRQYFVGLRLGVDKAARWQGRP